MHKVINNDFDRMNSQPALLYHQINKKDLRVLIVMFSYTVKRSFK